MPVGVVTDASKLRQILVNLLGNAVKFTREGGVTLRVSEEPAGRLRLDVADTGIGMSEAELATIFDPFKQVEAGKAAGGTGLPAEGLNCRPCPMPASTRTSTTWCARSRAGG